MTEPISGEIRLWFQGMDPAPWRIDKDNTEGIEIVADNGNLVAIEKWANIPPETRPYQAVHIRRVTRANFHAIVYMVNHVTRILRTEKEREKKREMEGS